MFVFAPLECSIQRLLAGGRVAEWNLLCLAGYVGAECVLGAVPKSLVWRGVG
nr:MAG TPA: hypothetical protein [Caudoviricetes sp.]